MQCTVGQSDSSRGRSDVAAAAAAAAVDAVDAAGLKRTKRENVYESLYCSRSGGDGSDG